MLFSYCVLYFEPVQTMSRFCERDVTSRARKITNSTPDPAEKLSLHHHIRNGCIAWIRLCVTEHLESFFFGATKERTQAARLAFRRTVEK
jgi:hypothetical protein